MNTHSYRAKDGTLITGIPDDIGDNDPRLIDFYKQMKSAGQTTAPFGQLNISPERAAAVDPESAMVPGTESQMTPPSTGPAEQPPQTPLQFAGQVVSELPQNAGVAARGLVKGAMSGATMIADPITMLLNKVLPPEMQQLPPSQGLTVLFQSLGVKEPQNAAQEVLEAASMGLGSGLATLGTGAALAPAGVTTQFGTTAALGRGTVMQEAGKMLSTGPVQQLIGSVGAEEGSTIARQQGAGPLVQFGAGLAGGMAGSGAGNLMSLQPRAVNPMQKVVDASEGLNTQLMTSDVFPPKTFAGKAAQSAGERIPFAGTGPVRAAQQRDRIKDIKNLFAEHGAFETVARASDDVMLDLANKRSANFARWEDMKQSALKSVVDAKPGVTVPVPKTIKSIDASIAYLQSLKNEDVTPAINKLLNWKEAIQNQSPENVLTNKQMLGDIFDAPEMGAVKRIMGDELKKTYDAVKYDLTDFIGSAGGEQAKNKWIIANKEESKLFKDLDLGILKNTLEKGGERPEVIKNMLMNKDRSVVEALNKGLTAKGRASAVTAVLQEVAKKVGEDVSTDKFITELKRLKASGDPLGVFMQPDDYKTLEGLVRVLKATSRASDAALHTPTGQQLYLPIGVATGAGIVGKLGDFLGGGGTGTALAAGAGLTGMGLAGAAARIYESAPVRNVLMKLPTVKPGSVEEAALFKRLLEAVQATQTKPSDSQYAASTRSK